MENEKKNILKKKNQMNTEQSNIIYNLNIYIQNYKI